MGERPERSEPPESERSESERSEPAERPATLPAHPVIGQSAPAGVAVPPPTVPNHTPSSPARTGPAVDVGHLVQVTVATVGEREVEVRLADGRTGVVPAGEFGDAIKVGDVVEAAQLAREDRLQRAVLSVAWARKQRAWERVIDAHAAGSSLSGRVVRLTKGGAVVDLGLRAFMPASLAGESPGVDLAALVGTDLDVAVVEVDRDEERVIVSARAHQRRQRRHAQKELLRSLEPGTTVHGKVVSTADYGAVVDLGGVRGLVHRSELTWGRLESVESVVSVGDEVDVVVLEVHRGKPKISLSLRATRPDPFAAVQIGSVVPATVVLVVDYGVFMRLDEGGAEGLVHISELSDLPGHRPEQLVVPGEQLMVKVLDVDLKRRRLALSVRRVLVDD